MEDRWEATDGSMRGVVMGDIVMASGCDGKWLTVDVPFSEQGDSGLGTIEKWLPIEHPHTGALLFVPTEILPEDIKAGSDNNCLLYTSPSPRDATLSRMPSSA